MTGRLEIAQDATFLRALHAAGWNKRRAAEALGVSRSTLYRRLKSKPWAPVVRESLSALGFPTTYEEEIAKARSIRVRIDNAAGRKYWVVDGPQVQAHLPDIWAWAHSRELLGWCSERAGSPLVVSPYRNAVHVNWTDAAGYPEHADSNPFAVVAYLSSVGGGELVIPRVGEFAPTRGTMVFFCGHSLPHYVRPSEGDRVTVVVSLDFALNPLGREKGRDSVMY